MIRAGFRVAREDQKRPLSVVALLSMLTAVTVLAVPFVSGTAAARQAPEVSFLGFEVGDEMRYRLEGEGAAAAGPIAEWAISLEAIDRTAAVGVFELTYSVGGYNGEVLANSIATASVTADGFPVRVQLMSVRLTPMGMVQYSADYLYEPDKQRYNVILRMGGIENDDDFDIEDSPRFKPSVPAGVYLFTPLAAECITAARSRPPKNVAASRAERWEQLEVPCGGREPVFANPALLGLTMPALWEAGTGAIDFVAVSPTGIVLQALDAASRGSGGSSLSFGGVGLGFGGGPKVMGREEDAFAELSLAAEGDLQQIDIGGRTVDAWFLRASTPLEGIWVDGKGGVVRLDIAADRETGARYRIRRLRPSEY